MENENVVQAHAPNQPLEDGLPNLPRVDFDNIDDGMWYFLTPSPVWGEDETDCVIFIMEKTPEAFEYTIEYKRERQHPDWEFDWLNDDTQYRITRDEMENGDFQVYTYMPEPAQQGGGLAEDVRSALSQPVMTLPAGTDFSKVVLPARDRFQEQNVLVQTQAGTPALPLVVRNKSRQSRRRRRSRKVQKSRKRKTRRKH